MRLLVGVEAQARAEVHEWLTVQRHQGPLTRTCRCSHLFAWVITPARDRAVAATHAALQCASLFS